VKTEAGHLADEIIGASRHVNKVRTGIRTRVEENNKDVFIFYRFLLPGTKCRQLLVQKIRMAGQIQIVPIQKALLRVALFE
ncbi:MAG: hypothetical protein ABI863_05125, partial [Ginsengibacter sp.]